MILFHRWFFMAAAIIVAVYLVPAFLVGCTSPDTAQRTLSGSGYTKVVLTGYRFLGCGEDDLYHDGFEAVGPSGQRVTGVVCRGPFKGSTIRLD
jgi:hypothetical protein